MKAPALEFHRPDTVQAALAILAEGDGAARVLAGGQSLVPMLNLRVAFAETLVDIGAIQELAAIEDAGNHVRLGASVSHARIEDGQTGDYFGGMLGHVAGNIAYRAIRNRGTIGGSLAHADPAADWPVAMIALGANVEIAGSNGSRKLPVDEFMVDVFTTALQEDEILTAICIPKASPKLRWSFQKMRKKAGAFGEAIAAAVHDPESGLCRVVAGSSAIGGPQRFTLLETALQDGDVDDDAIRDAVTRTIGSLGRYETQIHTVCLRRAIEEVRT
ncbi:FAD binding domain-containing protein [Hoeflea sp. WL0058]|uniref:FAD binding domain-containing protein n=1 Tax=Flavimaribacter sediminis TaxID=2865987 RepID=A0AAE2ZLN2_9HYPH|nr:FAD binding domain-containing protein [Flavimaribacter sediminis]